MSKKKILITGVAGLIGLRLADWIIENKPEYELEKGIYSFWKNYIK